MHRVGKIPKDMLLVARIGRPVGIHGALKLHIMSDFPSIFTPKTQFHTLIEEIPLLCIAYYDNVRKVAIFESFNQREKAIRLVNMELYSSLQESLEMCALKEGEFLWQELFGVGIYDRVDEEEEISFLGVIEDIERIGKIDYFVVKTHEEFIKRGFVQSFLIPNISHYVLSLSKEGIQTHNARFILEQS